MLPKSQTGLRTIPADEIFDGGPYRFCFEAAEPRLCRTEFLDWSRSGKRRVVLVDRPLFFRFWLMDAASMAANP